MKIAVGLIKHESNSFNPQLTTLKDFNFYTGKDMLKNYEVLKGSSLLGMIEVFKKLNIEIVPLVCARPRTEGGFVTPEAYLKMKMLFKESLQNADNIDGICLDLHGSMTVKGIGDAEGDLLAAARSLVGNDIPIVCALDLHAMVTPQMVRNADGIVGYRTAPHVDKVETGRKAASLLYESITKNYSLYMAGVSLPMLVSGEQSETDAEPMVSLINELKNTDNIDGVFSSSYFLGFPWADVSYNKGCALVVARTKNISKRQAINLANKFWDKHKQFNFTTVAYSFPKALEVSRKEEEGPVFICDTGDNPGAGGSQNITYPLEIMLKENVSNALLGVIADRSAYLQCKNAGINNKLSLKLGQRNVNPSSSPFVVDAVVKNLDNSMGVGAAVVSIKEIDLVITEKRVVMTEPQFLINLKINPENYNIVVLKGGYLAPKYKSFAKKVYLALTPGYTAQIFRELEYNNLQRPIYPLDKDIYFDAVERLMT